MITAYSATIRYPWQKSGTMFLNSDQSASIFDKENIHLNPPPLISVKIGDIPARDIEEQKIKRFTKLFKTGILIDNSRHAKSLEQINRGICVHGLEPKF